jgi:hypothetical protein
VEACRRSDAYAEKRRNGIGGLRASVTTDQLSSSVGVGNGDYRVRHDAKRKRRFSASGNLEMLPGSGSLSVSRQDQRRTRRKVVKEYRPPITDEKLAERLKQVHSIFSF